MSSTPLDDGAVVTVHAGHTPPQPKLMSVIVLGLIPSPAHFHIAVPDHLYHDPNYNDPNYSPTSPPQSPTGPHYSPNTPDPSTDRWNIGDEESANMTLGPEA